jgi:hypothetical protein
MPVTIDEQPRYITTSAIKDLMKTLDDEVQTVYTTVTALNNVVQSNSATWNTVTALSGKQDKLDFEYKELEM